MKICPTTNSRADIETGYFASPVPLPYTLSLDACNGKFNDPDRDGYRKDYKWGQDGTAIGHQGNDLGIKSGGPVTAMADGIVAWVDLDPGWPNSAAGVWLAVLHQCLECGGWFLMRYLHLLPGSVVVAKGQSVIQGQLLAKGDTSGNARWSHLHLDFLHSNSTTANKASSFGPDWGIPYDPQAWGIINTPAPGTNPVPPPVKLVSVTVNRPQIRRGDTGKAVAELRFLLSMPSGTLFDSAVELKVREWQTAKKLTVDGVVGKDTWFSMLNY